MNLESNSSFYLTLLSGCSSDYYPENSLSKFTVKLPQELNCTNGDWDVGLTRFSFTSLEDTTFLETVEEVKVIFTANAYKNVHTANGILDVLQSTPNFMKNIHSSIFFDSFKKPQFEIKDSTIINVENNNNASVEFTGKTQNIKLPINTAFTVTELFNAYFAKIPNKHLNKEIAHLKEAYTYYNQFPNRSVQAAIDIYKCRVSEDISTTTTTIKTNLPNYICMYSDIIKPRIIGNQLSRFLSMTPVLNESILKERTEQIIRNVEYCRLERTRISEINILIADETGEQLNFRNDTFATMLLLHFRKSI